MSKPNTPNHYVMDYETICNCFVGVFQHYTDETKCHVFVIHQDRNDLPELLEFLQGNIENNEWHISYNGLAFDAQITHWLLKEQRKLRNLKTEALTKQIYEYAQKVIDRSYRGEFQEFSPNKMKIRQIDLFKMNHWDNKAKMSSLKWIQYSMDWENVEEMPHKHYQAVEDNRTLQQVINYCINDVRSTRNIMQNSKEQIQLRQALTKEYGIDLYSASEPRISKELFLHFLSQKLGMDKSEIKQLRTPRTHIVLADVILPYVKFKTPEFQQVLDYFRTKIITSTKDKFKYTLDFKDVKTDYGLGGIHGAANAGIYTAEKDWTIMTSDVASFYPNLAIKNGFAPEHLPAKEFGELYEWFYTERKKIPKTDPKNYVYKIILNSTYGLTGDENSFLYDPRMTMQITINGQLLLSMLYEELCLEIPEAVPLMQNTDGLEMMIPTEKVDTYLKVCDKWCALTKLELEHGTYQKMIIRDVNNYIAISTEAEVKDDPKSGKNAQEVYEDMRKKILSYRFEERNAKYYYTAVKSKGAFEWEDLYKQKVSVLHKNKSMLVIPKAIHAYFVHGTSPKDYLESNTDIMDYCAGVKAKGEWALNMIEVVRKMPEKYLTYTDNEKRAYLRNHGWNMPEKDRYNKPDWCKNQLMDLHDAFRCAVSSEPVVERTPLQKITRYFVSNDGGKIVKNHPDGREIQVESGQWLQTVIDKVDKKVPFEVYDIDTQYYLQQIEAEITNIEKERPNSYLQLTLF